MFARADTARCGGIACEVSTTEEREASKWLGEKLAVEWPARIPARLLCFAAVRSVRGRIPVAEIGPRPGWR